MNKIADKSKTKSELILLNLILEYPVRWSKYKVLRDFIQNFYDAAGSEDWNARFSYTLHDGRLQFTVADVGFSYDWLIHIGASTKREGKHAGYFGEGFKIASLCALRDHEWNIEMASRDWELKVVTSELEVDGNHLNSLAYRVWRKKIKHKDTVLCLYPFHEEDLLKTVLLSFYYPQNPLLGKEIWNSAEGAVFCRSKHPKPEKYPSTYACDGEGIVFAGYQAFGSFKHPLVFCLHEFRFTDRERRSFYKMEVIDLIKKVVGKMPPEASAKVLQALKKRWNDRPRKKYDFESWHGIVRTLIRSVSQSKKQKMLWKQKYPDLLVTHQTSKKDLPRYNRRKQAMDWFRDSAKKYRLVQDGFLELEYPTLEEVCEQHDGFSIVREPEGKEVKRIQVMEALASLLLSELLEHKKLPPCKIIISDRAIWNGMAICIPLKHPLTVSGGLKLRYRLPYVALKKYLLRKDNFGCALSTYLHELAHMFGGDGSAHFSRAITEILEITLTHNQLIDQFRKKWQDN